MSGRPTPRSCCCLNVTIPLAGNDTVGRFNELCSLGGGG